MEILLLREVFRFQLLLPKEQVLGKMGVVEEEDLPFCREQRPKGQPAGLWPLGDEGALRASTSGRTCSCGIVIRVE